MQGLDVKKLRKKLGLSQEELGIMLGYQKPQVRVSEIERNEKEVSNQIVALCKLIEENYDLKEKIKAMKNIFEIA